MFICYLGLFFLLDQLHFVQIKTNYSGYQSHATFSTKMSRQNLSFGGHQSSPPPYFLLADCIQNLQKKAQLCSGQLVKIIILVSVCSASSKNTLVLNIS